MIENNDNAVFTIGHSNHTLSLFIGLLKKFKVEMVIDVRSRPYSRHVPQYNKPDLQAALQKNGFKYLFLGNRLGGMPKDKQFYDQTGRVLYSRLAASAAFKEGIKQVLDLVSDGQRLVLMCGEQDPGSCHRRLLVGRVLALRGVGIKHILSDGSLAREEDLSEILCAGACRQMSLPGMDTEDPWRSVNPVGGKPGT